MVHPFFLECVRERRAIPGNETARLERIEASLAWRARYGQSKWHSNE